MNWFRRNAASQQSAQPSQTARNIAPSPAPSEPTIRSQSGNSVPVISSTMMDYPLTVQFIFQRAKTLFAKRELVTVTADGYERSSFGEVCANSEKIAAALSIMGVKKGDRIATLAWNTTRHLELYMAIPTMGAVLHTLNLRLAPDQLGFIIQDAADKIIFADADLLPLLEKCRQSMGSVERIVVMNGAAPSQPADFPPILQYEDVLANAPSNFTWPELDEREAAAMCYTSGTTANPKGVVYSHRSVYLHASSLIMTDTIGLSGTDIAMPIVPMFHVNAWGLPHAAAMVGSKVVFPGKFMDPARIARAMADERVTLSAGVPTIWLGLVQFLEKNPTVDLSSIRYLVCGGSAAPAALIAALDKYNLKLLHAWGMTETSPIGSISRLKAGMESLSYTEQLAIRAKQGFPVPGVEIRIMNMETGQEAPWDGISFGEIQIRGPWITGSYFHSENLEQGESKFIDGWFRTGDVATMDPDGYIQIVDRTKDVIKSGGEWISSVQMESIIMAHPRVAEAAVVGMPHPKWQERPVAAVVMKQDQPPMTLDELRAFLEPQVAKWWLPDAIVITSAIPKTSVGKFDKKVLRSQLQGQVHLTD